MTTTPNISWFTIQYIRPIDDIHFFPNIHINTSGSDEKSADRENKRKSVEAGNQIIGDKLALPYSTVSRHLQETRKVKAERWSVKLNGLPAFACVLQVEVLGYTRSLSMAETNMSRLKLRVTNLKGKYASNENAMWNIKYNADLWYPALSF